MENCWTSNKSINGLRHFVLINEIIEKNKKFYFLVSVLDAEINLRVSSEELLNSGNWEKGWLNLPKKESITNGYLQYKANKKKKEGIDKIYLNEDSSFNIS